MCDDGVRVAVLDGRPLVRAGLTALLDGHDGIVVAASFASAAALHAWDEPLAVVVLDPLLDGGHGLAANVAAARSLGAGALALAGTGSGALIRTVAAAGAAGVVLQTAGRTVLQQAVLGVARHPVRAFTVWCDDRAVPRLADAGLSPGERQVLALYAAGAKAETVARSLGLSASTVTTYVSRIRRKYEQAGRAVSSRIDLYQRAVEDGVLAPESELAG